MLKPLLLGLRILVADNDYIIAHETCRYLSAAGAEIMGPLPSNEEVLLLLSGGARPDGALVKQTLRDGGVDETVQALVRLKLPYLLTASEVPLARAWNRDLLLFTPLGGVEPAQRIRGAFGVGGASGRASAI